MSTCVEERVLRYEVDRIETTRVIHLASSKGDSYYRGIRCSKDEVICFPGHTFEGEPTCPDCIAIANRRSGRGDPNPSVDDAC